MEKTKELTPQEIKAIKALEKVAKIWPESLWLWSGSGQLCVMKYDWSYAKDGMNRERSVDRDGFVTHIKKIPNDGGDW